MITRMPNRLAVYGEEQRLLGETAVDTLMQEDVQASLSMLEDRLQVFVKAEHTPLCRLVLQWDLTAEEQPEPDCLVLGDAWERGYGDLEWQAPNWERKMPWYCLTSNGSDSNPEVKGRKTQGFGVCVRPSAFCLWQFDGKHLSMQADLRCGGVGVLLNGRQLHICDIVFAQYCDTSAFDAACSFCRALCKDPILPKTPVYGFNNWYYAYGVSSEEEILEDAKRLSFLSEHCTARPYMVIDDGWQVVFNDGPWHRGNEKFPNMAKLASDIRALNVRPGIWVRPLRQNEHREQLIPKEWRFRGTREFLDPSHPEVLQFIAAVFSRLVKWGYELIKFDFVTNDLFWQWGMECPAFMGEDGWSFYDRSRTTAEIITELYRTIRRASGNAVLIGCNAVSHLCAGLVEVNRTGDDTSGREWERTRKMGVNTLAFRMPQNRAFYLADADCVGITPDISWKRNEQWLRALAKSGSTLFVSWDSKCDAPEIWESVRSALESNSDQTDDCRPLDWMENLLPKRWLVNGEEVAFDWE